jgi:predicted O-methyltransferase YrrM
MEVIHSLAEEYSKKYSSQTDPLLIELEQLTTIQHSHSHMISGAVQGKFLEFISKMIQPSRILEIGTFTGYSALCLAKGLSSEGTLHTIEIREEDARIASDFFTKSEKSNQIHLHIGNAKDIIPTLHEQWDLVFIDADKVSYIEYYNLTLPLVRKGGWILADNILFHGHVLEEELKGKNAKAIQAFNEYVAKDNRVEQVVLTIRDGLTLIHKK